MERLQEMGKQLVELPAKTLALIDLPDDLHEAITFARSIRSHEARRRQLQYIGRIMRSVNAEEINRQLLEHQHAHQAASQQHHLLENLRDSLIDNGDETLNQLLEEHPAINRKELQRLVRDARTEHQQGRSGKSYKALFRFLRDRLGKHTGQGKETT